MARTKEQLIARATRVLPRAFHPWLHWLCGQAAAMAEAEAAVDTMAAAVLPSTAEGPWLQALAEDQAIAPRAGEGDEALRARIRAGQLGSDIVSLDRALGELLGETPYALVEGWQTTRHLDSSDTEYLYAWFLRGPRFLRRLCPRVYVVLDDGLPDETLRAVADLCNRWRAAGVSVVALIETGLADELRAAPWTGPLWAVP